MAWGERGLATVFTFALAAILGPRDFGIVAMALVYISFLELFLEQGLATAIIQREHLEQKHLDSAFWLNVVFGLALAGITLATSGLWAQATDVPELELVIQVLAVTVVMSSLVIVQRALLERRLEFKRLAIRANVAALAGGASGTVLAIEGFGVWALVGLQMVNSGVSLLLYWSLGHYVPRLSFSTRHARELLAFSGGVLAASVEFGGIFGRPASP
jgi:PST family polysaccharide transporter